ncbi:MAG: acyltransferase family protein [Pseudomonadota bacterium]
MSAAKLTYRPDVDGLRAVAVLGVVLYHFGFEPVTGGFAGVDIFFVISGFLITSILRRELEQKRFSILEFYARRVRRIIPPLLVVVAATVAIGYIVLLPDDLVTAGKSAFASVVFASNILFFQFQDYFDTTAEVNALLHTWSLAVEEQFYVFFPLLLVGLVRFRQSLPAWLSALVVSSFALSVYGVRHAPEATFYLLPFRAWELLLGALVACWDSPGIKNRTAREVLACVGIAGVVAPLFLISSASLFPGETALPVCAGTALIIVAGRGDTLPLVNRLLATRAFVFVGLVSYSMYLWHWPGIVLTRYYLVRDLTLPEKLIGLIIVFAVSVLSWRFVEQPFRTRGSKFYRLSRIQLFGSAMVGSALVGAMGLALYVKHGFPDRISAEVQLFADARFDISPERERCHSTSTQVIVPEASCVYGAGGKPARLAIWGDSHAVELAYAIGELAARQDRAVRHLSASGCPPTYGLDLAGRPFCGPANVAYVEYLVESDDTQRVLIVGRFHVHHIHYGDRVFEALEDSIRLLSAAGKQVYLLLPVPEPGVNVPRNAALLTKKGAELERLDVSVVDHTATNEAVITAFESLADTYGVILLDPVEALCRDGICRAVDQASPNFFDVHHLSMHGARAVSAVLSPALFR